MKLSCYLLKCCSPVIQVHSNWGQGMWIQQQLSSYFAHQVSKSPFPSWAPGPDHPHQLHCDPCGPWGTAAGTGGVPWKARPGDPKGEFLRLYQRYRLLCSHDLTCKTSVHSASQKTLNCCVHVSEDGADHAAEPLQDWAQAARGPPVESALCSPW